MQQISRTRSRRSIEEAGKWRSFNKKVWSNPACQAAALPYRAECTQAQFMPNRIAGNQRLQGALIPKTVSKSRYKDIWLSNVLLFIEFDCRFPTTKKAYVGYRTDTAVCEHQAESDPISIVKSIVFPISLERKQKSPQ